MTITEDYPSCSSETSSLLKDQFMKSPKWYDMYTEKDFSYSKVLSWPSDPVKLNSCFSRVAKHSLPLAPSFWPIYQAMLRRWERPAQDQIFMCNQAAGLSQCLNKVQEPMVNQLKVLHGNKGRSSSKSQQAFDELGYLVIFNTSITHSMARTMQDLSEGIFINIANQTLARRYYLRTRIKQDTLTAQYNPLHMHSLFPDKLLVKAEEEISHHEEKHSTSSSQKEPWKQIKHKQKS